MGSYYIMQNKNLDAFADGFMEIEDWKNVEGFDDWGCGEIAEDKPLKDIVISVVTHGEYEGLPPDLHDHSVPLISSRLKEVFDSIEIKNINYFPVLLKHSETGREYNYYAFNLVGCIAAIDLQNSNVKSYDGDFIGDTHIFDLALDEKKIDGKLIFRLQEQYSAIIVHYSVKDALEKNKIDTLKFVRPEDYMAL